MMALMWLIFFVIRGFFPPQSNFTCQGNYYHLTHTKKMSANKCCEIILGQSMDDKTHSLIG